MADKIFITTPIYYVNDEPHIGHAYTTIAADVLARHHRRENGGKNVFFLTGTDEHGSKVAARAEKEGKEPQAFADEVAATFKAAWQELGISNNYFIRTTDTAHVDAVQKILLRLKAAKTPTGLEAIYEGVYKGLYCVGCERFLKPKELVDGKCPDHGIVPQELEEKNWFFRLSDYLPAIRAAIEDGTLSIVPEGRKNETLGLIEQGIDDFSISRSTVTWGVPIPWDESQKAYVWVDALSNYITALGFPDDEKRTKQWWTDARVAQLMAVDILKFHAIYWPALLLALGLAVPKELYVHGFFTIDGKKMSKTLGNTIRPGDLVARYGADAARYLLLSQFSFGYESDIRAEEFDTKYHAELANGLGNLLSRVTNMVEKYLAGALPAKLKHDAAFRKEAAGFVEHLRFRDALLLIGKKITEANQRIDTEKPWTLTEADPARLKTILAELAGTLHDISFALEPFMPGTSETIGRVLGAKPVVKYASLFARIET